jgi:hypothetical protein
VSERTRGHPLPVRIHTPVSIALGYKISYQRRCLESLSPAAELGYFIRPPNRNPKAVPTAAAAAAGPLDPCNVTINESEFFLAGGETPLIAGWEKWVGMRTI